MHRYTKKAKFLILVMAVLLLVCGCSGKADIPETEIPTQETIADKKESIETMLVFCVDGDEQSQDTGDYRNGNKAELLLLLVMDREQEKTTVLQLNPNTAVDFTPPGTQEALEIPLGQVYSYGSGGSDSGFAQLKAVSRYLNGITMDHYLMFTMDAVAIVNDFVGGVSLELTEDLQAEYPEQTLGERVSLDGERALEYLRLREAEDAALTRYMERQCQYMLGLFPQFFQKAQDDDFLAKLTLQLGEGMASDLTLSQMVQMLELLERYELENNVVTMDGTAEEKDEQWLFFADEASRSRIMETLFY